MANEQIIILTVAALAVAGAAYHFDAADVLASDEPEIEIELLTEPIAGESNTVQAHRNGTALAGETLYINGEPHGELNDAGITEFTVPDIEELTLEVADGSATLAVSDSDPDSESTGEEREHGITLDSDPVAGEINRIILYNEGNRLTGETAYINGEELDETSNTGTVTFTVPNTEEITISTGLEGVEDATFEVEGYEEETETEERDQNETETESREGLELRKEPVAEEWNTVTLYENDEAVEGEEIFVNDESIGLTDEFGETDFEAPNEEEITIYASNFSSIKHSVDKYAGELSIEVSFQDELYQGEQNTLQVTGDGGFLEEVEVFIDNQTIGHTDQSGELELVMPEEDQIEVFIEEGSAEFEQTFDVDHPDYIITGLEPNNTVEENRIDFSSIVEVQNEVDYEKIWNSQIIDQGALEQGVHILSEEKIVWREGTYQYEVVLLDDQYEVKTKDTEFTLTQEIDHEFIETEYSVDGHKAEFAYETYLDGEYDLNLIVNQEVKENDENVEGNTDRVREIGGLEPKEHEWYIELENPETMETFKSETKTFETTEEPPQVAIDLRTPIDDRTYVVGEDGVTVGGHDVYFEAEIEMFEEGDHTYELLQNDEKIDEGSLEPESDFIMHTETIEEKQEYKWEVKVKKNGEEVKTSETRTLTYTE